MTSVTLSKEPAVRPWTRIAAAMGSEVAVARLAIGVVAVHVLDDNFLQPNPGTSGGSASERSSGCRAGVTCPGR